MFMRISKSITTKISFQNVTLPPRLIINIVKSTVKNSTCIRKVVEFHYYRRIFSSLSHTFSLLSTATYLFNFGVFISKHLFFPFCVQIKSAGKAYFKVFNRQLPKNSMIQNHQKRSKLRRYINNESSMLTTFLLLFERGNILTLLTMIILKITTIIIMIGTHCHLVSDKGKIYIIVYDTFSKHE